MEKIICEDCGKEIENFGDLCYLDTDISVCKDCFSQYQEYSVKNKK